MVTAGTLVENQDAVNTFDSIVRNSAWAQQVYHINNRHGTIDGVTAPTSEYSSPNPASGASVGGIGSDGTTIIASTVYNHQILTCFTVTQVVTQVVTLHAEEDKGFILWKLLKRKLLRRVVLYQWKYLKSIFKIKKTRPF
jgi:hypothetical protein